MSTTSGQPTLEPIPSRHPRDGLADAGASRIPCDSSFDGTLALLREGYDFAANRCRRRGSDAFRTRIMGMQAVCVRGREAAELFYDESRLQRGGALPRRVITSLFGKGAVHTLDDEAHRRRKAAFLALMGRESMEDLASRTAEESRRAVHDWEARGEVVLFDEVQRILTRATCSWAGVPIEDHEMAARARDFGLMIDAFGGVGPRLWKGKLARARTERWMKEAVERARSTSGSERPESALAVMSGHRDLKGRLLPARVAAVELINVIRPTVAVSWFIAFAALALHEHPAAREQLAREGAGSFADLFMQEVRRYYPCTHYLGARVRQPFVWRGHRFGTGTLVVLDVYGTDHDPRLWDAPDEFRPSRFEGWPGDPFSFIPQGGGSRTVGHRCPGEWITMHNTALALHFLTRGMVYEIAPGQDLRIDRGRMPTRPASGVVVRHVRALEALDRPAPPLPSTFAVRGASAEARGGGEGRS